MSKHYELRRGETLPESFRRIASEQLTRVVSILTDHTISAGRRVHEVRKRLKESRALVRLFRPALGADFEEQNRWYREAGRTLAVYRDAIATVEAVAALPRNVRTEIGGSSMRKLTRLVRLRSEALYADSEAFEQTVDELMLRVASMRLRIHELPLDVGDASSAVETGFAAIVSSGRRAMREAYDTNADEAFHDWRKRVKDHWYHVQLFVPVWPQLLAAREKALDELSHFLGEHHDLVVVREVAAAAGEQLAGVTEVERIGRILGSRQKLIARKARPLAERLYSARPRDHAREIIELWRAWQRE